MRVQVLTPWQHNGVEHEVGSFVDDIDEQLVRALKGTLGQEHVPAPDPEMPAAGPADANGVREEV